VEGIEEGHPARELCKKGRGVKRGGSVYGGWRGGGKESERVGVKGVR